MGSTIGHPYVVRTRAHRSPRRASRTAGIAAAILVALLAAPTSAQAARPLETSILDPHVFVGEDSDLAFDRVRGAGTKYVKIWLWWLHVAPGGAVKPAGFDARDPDDPRYRWASLDEQIVKARERGLEPILNVRNAPAWAAQPTSSGQPGTLRPSATELRLFMTAAAERYNGEFVPAGSTDQLPRVRFWEAWNEPNLAYFLRPQWGSGRPVSPGRYRTLVRAFATGVRSVNPRVHPDNLVIAGGLAPFGGGGRRNVAPLRFMRAMLCVSVKHKRACNLTRNRVPFDIWAHHPYTSGGPTHRAAARNDVSIGDLPAMRRVLTAARRLNHIHALRPVRFWVTEFAWDTKKPDPRAVPLRLHARWVAEALYRMWRAGVSQVTWHQLRDQPFPSTPWQSGLYFNSGGELAADRAKPALRAFRFPFVAFRRPNGIFVWGRTPWGTRQTVVLERRTAAGWRRVVSFKANGHGIFQRTVRIPKGYAMRARISGEVSSTFALKRPRAFRIKYPYGPFGCGGNIPC